MLYGFGDEFNADHHFLYVVLITANADAATRAVKAVRQWVREGYPPKVAQAMNARLKETELHSRHREVHIKLVRSCLTLSLEGVGYGNCPKVEDTNDYAVLYGRMLLRLAHYWQTRWPEQEGRLILHHLEDETKRVKSAGIHQRINQRVQDLWNQSEKVPLPFVWEWASEMKPQATPLILADNLVGARRRNFREDRPLEKNPDWPQVGRWVNQLPWLPF